MLLTILSMFEIILLDYNNLSVSKQMARRSLTYTSTGHTQPYDTDL